MGWHEILPKIEQKSQPIETKNLEIDGTET